MVPPKEIDVSKGDEEENNPPSTVLDECNLLDLDVADAADLPRVKGRLLLHQRFNVSLLNLPLCYA